MGTSNNRFPKGLKMWNTPKDVLMLNKFGKYAKVAGILFMLLGLVGILFPMVTSLVTVVFVASLLFFGGVIAGYFTYMTDRSNVLGWLKSILLIGVSFYMIYYPLGGVATLGLLLSIYFFMDAFTSFSMGLSASRLATSSPCLMHLPVFLWDCQRVRTKGVGIGYSMPHSLCL